MKTFLNRTAYPVRQEILKNLIDSKTPNVFEFENVIVGAGVSGLYSAYKLNT
jgi:ribulose 1,5-bisphosphate synthetase/thiazole synthase